MKSKLESRRFVAGVSLLALKPDSGTLTDRPKSDNIAVYA